MMGLWVLDYGSMIWDAIYKKSVEHILLHARCAVFSKSSYRPLGKRKRNIALSGQCYVDTLLLCQSKMAMILYILITLEERGNYNSFNKFRENPCITFT